MNRIFLSWDKPLCLLMADRLLNSEQDISRDLILVPTRDSGRKLREILAENTPRQALFPPRVMTVDHLTQPRRSEKEAGRIEEIAAWFKALGEVPHEIYPTLFPEEIQMDTSCRLDLAMTMSSLVHNLNKQGISCHQAEQKAVSDDERWKDISILTDNFLGTIHSWDLESFLDERSTIASQEIERLVASGGRLIVGGIPNMNRTLITALNNAKEAGVPVEIWIHAPASWQDTFDIYGCPNSAWSNIPIEIEESQIHVMPSPDQLAIKTCELISESAENIPALGVCDSDMFVALNTELHAHNWGLYDPNGRSFAGTGLMNILRLLARSSGLRGLSVGITSLAKSILLCSSLGIQQGYRLNKALDKLGQKNLPLDEDELINLMENGEFTKAFMPDILTIREWRNKMLEKGKLGIHLTEWLPQLAQAYGAQGKEEIELLESALPSLCRLQESDAAFADSSQALQILMSCLNEQRLATERGSEEVLDALGWMELIYRPEQNLILTGINEGMVPEGGVNDQFLPESLKQKLNILSFERTKIRDAFLLNSLLRSRDQVGRVDIVLSRLSSNNDPLTPSSLLMQCRKEQLPDRVDFLFRELPIVVKPLTFDRGNWGQVATPDRVINKVTDLDPTYENPWASGAKRFSPSLLKNFLSCPLSFWMTQVYGIKQDDFDCDKEDMNSADLGNLAHKVLEVFCQEFSTYTNDLTGEKMQTRIIEILEEYFTTQYGKNPLLPLELQKGSLEARLSLFAKQHLVELKEGWSCIEFEKEINDWSLDGYPMDLRVDRIDRHRDGRIRVIDYKTGKIDSCEKKHIDTLGKNVNLSRLSEHWSYAERISNRRTVLGRWVELQLPIYVMWAQEHYDTKNVQAAYCVLSADLSFNQILPWENLNEVLPQSSTGITNLLSARSWATETMRLIKEGSGLVSAEELGWKSPMYRAGNDLVSDDHETYNQAFGINPNAAQ